MTEVLRGTQHRVTLDAPGQYNVRRISDDAVTLDSPYSSATEAAIDVTLAEWSEDPPPGEPAAAALKVPALDDEVVLKASPSWLSPLAIEHLRAMADDGNVYPDAVAEHFKRQHKALDDVPPEEWDQLRVKK